MDFIKSKLSIFVKSYWKYIIGFILLAIVVFPIYNSVKSWLTKPDITPLSFPEKHDYAFDIKYENCQFESDIANHIERHNYCIQIILQEIQK